MHSEVSAQVCSFTYFSFQIYGQSSFPSDKSGIRSMDISVQNHSSPYPGIKL